MVDSKENYKFDLVVKGLSILFRLISDFVSLIVVSFSVCKIINDVI